MLVSTKEKNEIAKGWGYFQRPLFQSTVRISLARVHTHTHTHTGTHTHTQTHTHTHSHPSTQKETHTHTQSFLFASVLPRVINKPPDTHPRNKHTHTHTHTHTHLQTHLHTHTHTHTHTHARRYAHLDTQRLRDQKMQEQFVVDSLSHARGVSAFLI